MTNLSTEAIRELIKLMEKTLVDDAGLEMSSFQNSEAEKQFKEAIVALKQLSDSKFIISRPKSIGQAHRVIVQMQAEITQLRKDKAALVEQLSGIASRKHCFNDVNGCAAAQAARATIESVPSNYNKP